MQYIIRVNKGQIVLQTMDNSSPVAMIDLIKFHQIWSRQESYKPIKIENDEYEKGLRKGNLEYSLPAVYVETSTIERRIPILPSRKIIEIGFVGGRHRLDVFHRLGAKILPVHATSITAKNDIEYHFGASKEIIESEWLNKPELYL